MPNNITVKSMGVWKKFCNAQLAKEQEKKCVDVIVKFVNIA